MAIGNKDAAHVKNSAGGNAKTIFRTLIFLR